LRAAVGLVKSPECPSCQMYKAENERLWQEVDILLRVIEEHTYNTKEITDYIKSHKDIKYDDIQ